VTKLKNYFYFLDINKSFWQFSRKSL